MGKLAAVFPGQGSQSVGMGRDLFDSFAEAKSVFDEADKTAGRSLSKLCFEGPEEELKRTINTQPTILTVSLAAWACYKKLGGPQPDFVAGHSLGEISALVAANSIDITGAVTLVEKRAQLMEECPKGAMSAVLGVSADVLKGVVEDASSEIRSQGGSEDESVVIIANYNTREQLVISGSPKAVTRAGEIVKTKGGKAIPLPVGGAFHSPLMHSASVEFSKQLAATTLRDASCSVVQNFDAKPSKSAQEISDKLGKQMESAVRWYETVEFMISSGVDTFVEIGPGKVLAGLVKKIDKSVRIFNVYDVESLKAAISALQTAGV